MDPAHAPALLARRADPAADRLAVAAWQWVQAQVVAPIPTTGRIVALAPDHSPIVGWDLDRVVPVRWQGPSFNAESSQAAMETLELAHHGFLVAG